MTPTRRRLLASICALALAVATPLAAAAMNNPGYFPLQIAGSDFTITSAATQVGTPLTGFAGINAASFQVRMAYGSGGTNVTVYIQTTLDGGQSWIDIAAVQFTTSGGVEVVNLSALDMVSTPTAPTDGGMTPGTTLDGILGDQFRAKVISTGTYAGGTLVSVRGMAR